MISLNVVNKKISFTVINQDQPLSITIGKKQVSLSIANRDVSIVNNYGSGNFTKVIAGENLGGNRVVFINEESKAMYASHLFISDAFKILGVTTEAVVVNEAVEIQSFGEMEEASWNWNVTLPIYVGANGLLTQNIPMQGIIMQIAFPISPIKIYIDKKTIIVISS
jgi:hypothetical protein